MTHRATSWVGFASRFLATTLLVAIAVSRAEAAPADPVEDLRLALQSEFGEPTPLVLEFRRANLQKKVDALKTIGELRRALSLKEWEDPSRVVVNKAVREIDTQMRTLVAARLTKGIQDAVAKGDANARLAVANLIAELGPTIRGAKNERHGYARSLVPEVLTLAKDADPRVRLEALRALGSIFPRPEDAVPVFEKNLKGDNVRFKRLAATSLAQLVRVVSHLASPGRGATGVEATRDEVLETARAVIPACAAGMTDADPQVRVLSYQALQQAANALADLIRDGFPKKELPPEGRKLSDEERKTLLDLHDFVGREMKEAQPVFDVIKAQTPNLARGLQDPDPAVKLAAIQALESIGNARLRMKRRVLSVPVVLPIADGGDRGNRAALVAGDPLQSFLRDHLAAVAALLDPEADIRLRRSAIDFLDVVEEAALPALPVITVALADPDRFVRWAAARALSNLPAEKAAPAVPQLAKLLEDSDLNVRMAAAATLRGMNSYANAAAAALAQAVTVGDAEPRLAMMYALQALPIDTAKVAVPQLAEQLEHADPRVRRLAAETLGKLGAAAQSAIPALRKALSDDDAEVRTNASEAMLAILVGPVK